jgi:hypothetical protein
MEYLTAAIAFLATSLGLFGDLHSRGRKGQFRITKLGYAALLLAFGALSVSFFQTHSNNLARSQLVSDGQTILVDTMQQITAEIYLSNLLAMSEGSSKAASELESRLRELGKRLLTILQLYGDNLTIHQRQLALSLAIQLTENADCVGNEGMARDCLENWDAEITGLVAAANAKASRARKIPISPLKDHVFDFDHPLPPAPAPGVPVSRRLP